MSSWFVYIVESTDGKRLYTGVSTDPERRVREHNEKNRGAKATRSGRPWTLVYQYRCKDQGTALRREFEIKAMNRWEKLGLIGRSE